MQSRKVLFAAYVFNLASLCENYPMPAVSAIAKSILFIHYKFPITYFIRPAMDHDPFPFFCIA
jgi:hypothetical protein